MARDKDIALMNKHNILRQKPRANTSMSLRHEIYNMKVVEDQVHQN